MVHHIAQVIPTKRRVVDPGDTVPDIHLVRPGPGYQEMERAAEADAGSEGPESANNQLIDDSESSASQHQPDGVDLKPEY